MSVERGGAVLYARTMERTAAFYSAVLGMREMGRDEEHILLDSSALELVIRQMQGGVPSAAPDRAPARRTEAAVKLVFFVPSLRAVRSAVAEHGGVMDRAPKDWLFNGLTVWDALDPDGNVIQFRGPVTD